MGRWTRASLAAALVAVGATAGALVGWYAFAIGFFVLYVPVEIALGIDMDDHAQAWVLAVVASSAVVSAIPVGLACAGAWRVLPRDRACLAGAVAGALWAIAFSVALEVMFH